MAPEYSNGLTFHVGLHKTGSTSIQAALNMMKHRSNLLIVSPKVRRMLADPVYCSRVVAASRARHVIISDEAILGDMDDAYSDAGERARGIRDIVGDFPYEIVMYLRPQPEWLSSVFLQLVQQGEAVSAEHFWESIRAQENLAWSGLISRVIQESGAERVRVRAYVPHRDSVDDFFRCCGLGPAPRPTSTGIRINQSISALQAPILSALNSDESLTRDERLRLRHVFQDRLATGVSRDWSPFPEHVQLQIVDRYRDDWHAIAGLLDASDPEEAAVFRASVALWDRPAKRYPGSSISDSLIAEELLRTVKVLAEEVSNDSAPGIWSRVIAKANDNPADVPHAILRTLRSLRRS